MDKRQTAEQKVLALADTRAQVWLDASARAELRNEPVLAAMFRNLAWEISAEKNWLDSAREKAEN